MPTISGKDADRFVKRMLKKEKSKPTKRELEIIEELERDSKYLVVTEPKRKIKDKQLVILDKDGNLEHSWDIDDYQLRFIKQSIKRYTQSK